MQRLTLPDRLEIVQKFYANSRSFVSTQRSFSQEYGRHHRFDRQNIRRVVEKFEREFTLHDNRPPVRQRNARSNENIAAVKESVADRLNLSITRRSQELGLSYSTTWRILRLDVGLHPYKIVLTQQLKPQDHLLHREFADWALEQLANDPDFGQKIIFSDEAHFWLNGYVNKQNCRSTTH